MAQFYIDVDSGILRISQFIYSICPGMSQAALFSRAFDVPVHIREGLVASEIGTVYTFDLCHVLLFRVQLLVNTPTGCHSPELFPSLDTVTHVSVGSRSACSSGHAWIHTHQAAKTFDFPT